MELELERRKTVMKMLRVVFASLMMSMAGYQLARADTISIFSGTGTEGLGQFSQSLSYDGVKLTLTATNTTSAPALQGFRITAVGLVSPLSGLTYSNFSTTNGNFEAIYDFPMPPFPDGDFGASTSPTWLGMGMGHVADGLNNGESATFSWDVTGNGANLLSAKSYGDSGVYVRFKGLELSDKVPGIPCNPVPEPSSMILAVVGLGVIAARRRSKAR